MITVDAAAANEASDPDQSTVRVDEGQTFSEHDLLEMLLIPSGNNIARLLARWDAGTERAFVTKMNDAARSLGMAERRDRHEDRLQHPRRRRPDVGSPPARRQWHDPTGARSRT
jgi:hypothetical protein